MDRNRHLPSPVIRIDRRGRSSRSDIRRAADEADDQLPLLPPPLPGLEGDADVNSRAETEGETEARIWNKAGRGGWGWNWIPSVHS